ncbi:hypothetical protein E4V51_13705 [Paenibacillus sp. 28ISP30-2]|nr:hypothetical protein [Paenibacillus sp. 28ISP30-2]
MGVIARCLFLFCEGWYKGHIELIALTKKYTENRDYHVSTETERKRVIQEIVEDIDAYALPFFKRFEDGEVPAVQSL